MEEERGQKVDLYKNRERFEGISEIRDVIRRYVSTSRGDSFLSSITAIWRARSMTYSNCTYSLT